MRKEGRKEERHKISKNLTCQGRKIQPQRGKVKVEAFQWGNFLSTTLVESSLRTPSVITAQVHPPGLRLVCSVTCQGEIRQERFGNYMTVLQKSEGNDFPALFFFFFKATEVIHSLVNPQLLLSGWCNQSCFIASREFYSTVKFGTNVTTLSSTDVTSS